MIQLSTFCTCGNKDNHAAYCHTVKAAYMLAERYRNLATQIREYGQEQHAAIAGATLEHGNWLAGKRTGAYDIAEWLTSHAGEVERHAR